MKVGYGMLNLNVPFYMLGYWPGTPSNFYVNGDFTASTQIKVRHQEFDPDKGSRLSVISL